MADNTSDSSLLPPKLKRKIYRLHPDTEEHLADLGQRLFDETGLKYPMAALMRGLISLGFASIAGKTHLAADFSGARVKRGRKTRQHIETGADVASRTMLHFFETPHGSETLRLLYHTWSLDLLGSSSRLKLLARIEKLGQRPRASLVIETQRSWMAIDWLVRFYTAAWFDSACLEEGADKLRALTPIVDRESAQGSETVLREARASWNDARDLVWRRFVREWSWSFAYTTRKEAKDLADHLALECGRDAATAAAYLVKESDGIAPFWDPALTADWVVLDQTGGWLTDTLQSSVLELVDRMVAVEE